MTCDLNCYGEGAEPVPLPGSAGDGDNMAVKDLTLEVCKDFCMESEACEGIVYGHSMCYGKKHIYTSKCAPGDGIYTTEILGTMPKGVCALLGDPHIVTFDNPSGSFLDQFDMGEFHLVKSYQVHITGRFGYSKRFPDDSSTIGVAVSGSLIKGHTLVATYCGPEEGPKGFKVYWDGNEILKDLPSVFSSDDMVLHAEFDNMDPSREHSKARHTIGQEADTLPSYRFTFLPNWKVYVLLGAETMNVVIELHKQQGGQDGYCGTFNCDPLDDTLEALSSRNLAGVVDASESLFKAACPVPASQLTRGSGGHGGVQNCDAGLRSQAEAGCKDIPEKSLREACVYDACAAGSMEVVTDDIAVSVVEKRAEIDAGEIAKKFLSGWLRLGSPMLPAQGFACMGFLAASAFAGLMWLGRASRGLRNYRGVSATDGLVPRAASRLYDALTGGVDEELHSVVGSEHTTWLPHALAREHGIRASSRSTEADDTASDGEEARLLA